MVLFSGSGARRVGMFNAMLAENAMKGGQEILDGARIDALGAIDHGRGLSLEALGRGYDQARTDLTTNFEGAIERFAPYVESGRRAGTMYENSLGLNGVDGNAAAVGAFRESPGYRFSVDQATDAVARKASAIGALGSGNTMTAISDRAQGMANTEYGGWQDRLERRSGLGLQATTAQAGLQGQFGATLAGLGQQRGQNEAGIYTGAAGNESGIFQNIAGLGVNNLWQGIGAITGSLSNAQKQAQDNVNSGSSLGINALGSLVKLGSAAYGGGK